MSAMFEAIGAMPAPFNMISFVVLIGSAAGLLGAVVQQVRVFADNEADRRLKRDLAESGYSADEAERLLRAEVRTQAHAKAS